MAPSPTYSLTASGNQARLGQPIPEIFGRHKVVFDLAATPYQEYLAGEQYLFQLHCIGIGQYRLDALMIDDTPLASFEEVQYQVVPPGAAVTLMDAWVVTAVEVAGQELKGPNQLTNGETGWVGPFVANPAATTAHHIGIDVVFTNGLYYANNSGGLDPKTVTWEVWGRLIDDLGAALGDFILLAAETYILRREELRFDRADSGHGQPPPPGQEISPPARAATIANRAGSDPAARVRIAMTRPPMAFQWLGLASPSWGFMS